MLILGSEIRDTTVTIDGEGEQQFGSCAFHNATVASTVPPSNKSSVIVRNTQFLDRSMVVSAVVGCDPGGSQSFKTGTGTHCDRRARCEDALNDPTIVAGIRCTCAVPGLDQSDVSEFKDGTKCDQQSSARVYAESQVINFVLQKPLDASLSFLLSARGDHEVRVSVTHGSASETGVCVERSWLTVAPMGHNFSLSTAQSQMSVLGTVVARGSSVHCADGAMLNTTVQVWYGAIGAAPAEGSRGMSQTLTLIGTVAALPPCAHSRSAASTSLDATNVLAHDHEFQVQLLAIDSDGLPIMSTQATFRVFVGYDDGEVPIEIDAIRNAENTPRYSSTVPNRLHGRAGTLRVRVTLLEGWDGQTKVRECEVLAKEIAVQCAPLFVMGSKNECTPAADRGSICSRAKPRVLVGSNSMPIDLLQPLKVHSVIDAGLDEIDKWMSSQFNLSLTATASTKTSPLSTGIALHRPGEHKLQVTSDGMDVCTMFSGSRSQGEMFFRSRPIFLDCETPFQVKEKSADYEMQKKTFHFFCFFRFVVEMNSRENCELRTTKCKKKQKEFVFLHFVVRSS